MASYSSQGLFVGRKVAGCKLKSFAPSSEKYALGWDLGHDTEKTHRVSCVYEHVSSYLSITM